MMCKRPGKPGEIVRLPVGFRAPAIDRGNSRTLDCSAGDGLRVIISQSTAILMAEAFVDMANARRLYVDNLEASEAMTRAFGEIELLQKVVADGLDG